MAYAEIKGRCVGATGCKEWAISRESNPPTTERQTPRPGEDTVYSPAKYRETEGIKDVTNDYYKPSKTQQIDKTQYEDYGNLQGATSVIKRLTGSAVRRPANPTKAVVPSGYRLQRYDSSISSWVTMTYMPFEWYDCTTWANYYPSDGYDYVGYFASAHSSQQDTKTVLAQGGSTAAQNFAFDGMEDLDNE